MDYQIIDYLIRYIALFLCYNRSRHTRNEEVYESRYFEETTKKLRATDAR